MSFGEDRKTRLFFKWEKTYQNEGDQSAKGWLVLDIRARSSLSQDLFVEKIPVGISQGFLSPPPKVGDLGGGEIERFPPHFFGSGGGNSPHFSAKLRPMGGNF